MPIFKRKNGDFFKSWSPAMAYVLGFFAADGNLTLGKRGNHYIEFTSCDKDLLEKIKVALCSNHKIATRKRVSGWKTSYRLQIGSKTMFYDLVGFGFTPRKSLILKMPFVPVKYFSNFLRGYFDGDGNVIFGYFRKSDRKSVSPVLLTRLSSGSKGFLLALQKRLRRLIHTTGSLQHWSGAWYLQYSTNDSKKVSKLMYGSNPSGLIFLKRKYTIYLKAGVV